MRLGFLFFLFATIFGMCDLYAFSKLNEVDSLNNLLSGNAILELNSDNPLLRKYTYKNDSLFTAQVLSLIEDAQTVNNKDKEFKGLLFLGQLNLHKHNYLLAEHYFLKAQKKALSDTQFYVSTIKLAEIKIEIGQVLEALEYLRQCKEKVVNSENKTAHAQVLLKEGFCYTQLKNFDIAENTYNEAYSIIESNSLRALYGEIFKYRGHLNYVQLNYLNALANFYKSLEFFEQDTVIVNYAIILDYIGKIYFYQGNNTKALEYFNDAKILYLRLDDVKSLGMINLQIAQSNLKLKQFETARIHLNQALEYFNLINFNLGIAAVNLKFSDIYISLNYPDSAAIYLNKITPQFSKINLDVFELDFYVQNARYYIAQKNTDSVLYFAKKVESLKQLDLKEEILAYNILSDAYCYIGNYKQAFNYKSKITNLKDSVNQKINSYEIKILQSELELSQKKVVIEYLTSEREIQNQTIEENKVTLERQRVYTYLGITVSLFLTLFAFLLATFLHQKRKDNKKLSLRNKQIAQHKEEIELQSQHLLEVNEELEKLSIIARETDNGIKIMNAVGRVLWLNEGYTKMHGFTLDELQDVENLDLLGEQANIDIQQLVNVWYGDKQPITYESLNKTKANKDIWVQTTLTPILGEGGKIDKMIAIDSNINALKQAEKEILIKNQDITSSISYAKRIQEAMMTPFNILTDHYKNSFIFYKPKSIVSGDFYWMTYRHDKLVVVCADSTGHGVPGAFMSMIGMSFLNKIVNEKGFVSPAIILNRMRMNIINHLHQDVNEPTTSDGMDMSVITIDIRNNHLEFAGAMNPVVIVRKDDFIELKPDRMPVGYFDNEDRPFSATTLKLEPNDHIYMYTDGFYDQFGGKSGAKMKSQRFKNILTKASNEPVGNQKKFIKDEFNAWKGNHSQVDDVLIMGIHVN